MKKNQTILLGLILLLMACSKKDKDLVTPIDLEDRPQVLIVSDEEGGELEDEDKIKIDIELADVIDSKGEELSGTKMGLSKETTVYFSLTDAEGFDNFDEYIVGVEAYYEIDDCTEEEMAASVTPIVGLGNVTIPAGVTEFTIEFETNSDLFDDSQLNTDDRGFTFQFVSIENEGVDVSINSSLVYEYKALDDEGIAGKWTLDHNNSSQLSNFLDLYSIVSEDLEGLTASDIDEIAFEFDFEALTIVVVLTETETVTECDETETVNKEIEIEMDYDDLALDALSGDASFEGKVEVDDIEQEFEYSGDFSITNQTLTFTQTGELDDETNEITLTLTK